MLNSNQQTQFNENAKVTSHENVTSQPRSDSCIEIRNIHYFIWSKNIVFNFTAVRYSLHSCSEMIQLKRQFTIHVSQVSCAAEFMEASKNLPPSNSDPNLTLESFAIKTVSARLLR